MPSIRQLISRAARHGLTGLGIVLIATAGLVAQMPVSYTHLTLPTTPYV